MSQFCLKTLCVFGLLIYLNGKIPDWILYFSHGSSRQGVQWIPRLNTDIVMTSRAIIMPQGNNKDIQYIVNIHNPHGFGTVAEVNGNVDIASISDFDANVSGKTRFHRRNVFYKSKAIDACDNRDFKIENGFGEEVFSRQEDTVIANG